mgnify:CR=1 FL=1
MLLLVEDKDIYSLISQINEHVINTHSSATFSTINKDTNSLCSPDNNITMHINDYVDAKPLLKSQPKGETIISNTSNTSNNNKTITTASSAKLSADKITNMLTKANKDVYKTSDRFQQVAYASSKKSNANGYNTIPKKLMAYDMMNTKPMETSTTVISLNKLSSDDTSSDEITLTIPHETDSLFWSFYNLVYGNSAKAYEFIQNTCETERETRFQLIDVIRSNKDIIKPLKLSRTSIEENIVYDKHLNIRSVIALTHSLKCMNLLYVCGRTYHEVMLDESLPCHLIQKHSNKEKYGYCMNISMNQVDHVRETLWYMENMDKPMKSISSYKADDLRYICTQLQLEFKHDEKCTKPVMYERIIQYLSA